MLHSAMRNSGYGPLSPWPPSDRAGSFRGVQQKGYARAIETAGQTAAPFFVRRVEQFIEEHACDAIALADLTGVAGVSTRALQTGFRRFRDTTPMTYLRSIRLELARAELAKAGRLGSSVAAVAYASGFAHLGRFARDYQARFGELPSETLYRGSIGRTR